MTIAAKPHTPGYHYLLGSCQYEFRALDPSATGGTHTPTTPNPSIEMNVEMLSTWQQCYTWCKRNFWKSKQKSWYKTLTKFSSPWWLPSYDIYCVEWNSDAWLSDEGTWRDWLQWCVIVWWKDRLLTEDVVVLLPPGGLTLRHDRPYNVKISKFTSFLRGTIQEIGCTYAPNSVSIQEICNSSILAPILNNPRNVVSFCSPVDPEKLVCFYS